ncbi:MAG: serine/threonine protein kinase, partial [Planctomycetota bacterium]
ILDFGLAKIVDEPQGDGPARFALVSRTGQFFGTLAWASPEQIEQPAEQIDIRTDVYSLGVILYQLLIGRLPHTPSENLHQTIQAIVSEVPPRPRKLRPELPDDVETIVLRCLAKEPERRYQSAAELRADLRHYLAGRPIDAKRDHTWYVLRKTLGRHKAVAGLLLLVLLLIVGFATAMAILYPRALRAERLAQDNLEKAVTQAAKAEAVRDFLTEMLEYSDPFVSQGRRLTMREVLDAAALKIDGRFGGHPLVEAEVRGVMGDAYYHLGHLAEAEEHGSKGLALLEEELGEDHALVARYVRNLGVIELDRRHFDEAEALINRALEITAAELGEEHTQYADCLQSLAGLRQAQFRLEEADAVYGKVHAIYERHLDPGDERYLINLFQWSGLLISTRKLDSAIEKLDMALEIVDRSPHEHTPLRSGVLFYLGLAKLNTGELEEAESLTRGALECQQEAFGENHRQTAETYNLLGHILRDQKRYLESEQQYRKALGIYLELTGRESTECSSCLWNLGQSRWYQKDFEAAESYFQEALAIRRKIYGPEHHLIAASISRLGLLFKEAGRWAKALPYFEEAASIQEENLGKQHPWTARARALLGECLSRLERFEEAEPLLLDSLGVLEEAKPPNPTYVNHVLQSLIALYTAWEKPGRAEEYEKRLAAKDLQVGEDSEQ